MIATAAQNSRIMEARYHTTSGIRDGKFVYFVDGKQLSQKEFDEIFPVPTKIVMDFDKKYMKGENIDSTSNWMHKSKS
jgi:hypothetical protein